MADDVFGEVLRFEEVCYQRGLRIAQESIDQTSFQEGSALGTKHGAKIGREMGFYLAFARVLLAGLSQPSEHQNERIVKMLTALEALVISFSSMSPQAEDLQTRQQEIRVKYRQIRATLALKTTPTLTVPDALAF
eukprot:c9036_g1_i4.p1 GENE.c9036_g1_i4~~c9036_g1_i4.p1  ORF type:complete len:135 (-),score=34.16 c9036_g1_i4:147-551(-)